MLQLWETAGTILGRVNMFCPVLPCFALESAIHGRNDFGPMVGYLHTYNNSEAKSEPQTLTPRMHDTRTSPSSSAHDSQ